MFCKDEWSVKICVYKRTFKDSYCSVISLFKALMEEVGVFERASTSATRARLFSSQLIIVEKNYLFLSKSMHVACSCFTSSSRLELNSASFSSVCFSIASMAEVM